MESRTRQYDLSRYRLAFLLLPPPRSSRLLRSPFPLRSGHGHQAPLPADLTATAAHCRHVGRQVRRNTGRRFRRVSLFRGLFYNPLGELVGVAGPFSFAYRHAPIFAQVKMLKRLVEIQTDPVPNGRLAIICADEPERETTQKRLP